MLNQVYYRWCGMSVSFVTFVLNKSYPQQAMIFYMTKVKKRFLRGLLKFALRPD